MNITGASSMVANIRRVAASNPGRLAQAAYTEAWIEMTESKKRCPVWNPAVKVPKGVIPGLLRNSGTVLDPSWESTTLTITMAYPVWYAVFVHERTDVFHAIGEDHFLSSVLDESRPYLLQRIATRAGGVVGG